MTTQQEEQLFLSSTVASGHGMLGNMTVPTSMSAILPGSGDLGSVSINSSSNGGLSSDLGDPGMNVDLLTLLVLAGGSPPPVVDPDTQDYMNKLTHYLMGIGGSIVCCLGTVANAMSVAVLTRRAMKSSTYMYLAALAICDSLVLFFTLLLVLKDTKPPDSPHQFVAFHAILYPFVHPTAIVFQVTSIWLTLAFTVDRYIMICHPFKAEHMCRRSRARKVVVGIYVGGLLFNIPKYLEHYTKTDEFKIANSTQVYKTYGVMTTDIGNNELFRKIVHSWGYLIFVCGIPFLTLVVLNAFLIRAVRESRLKGKEINPKEKHRNDTTIMLIGVIIIFLICQGPALASRMTYAFKPGTTRTKAVFTLNEVASFLVILNSAINIVPYYLFGRKFRSEFWRIFCACLLDKDEIRRIVRSYSVSMDQRRASNYNVMEMNGMGGSSSKPNTPCSTSTIGTASTNNRNSMAVGLVDRGGDGVKEFDSSGKNSAGKTSGQRTGFGGRRYLALPLIHGHNTTATCPTSSTTSSPLSDEGKRKKSSRCNIVKNSRDKHSNMIHSASDDSVSFCNPKRLLQRRSRQHSQQQQQRSKGGRNKTRSSPSVTGPPKPSRVNFEATPTTSPVTTSTTTVTAITVDIVDSSPREEIELA